MVAAQKSGRLAHLIEYDPDLSDWLPAFPCPEEGSWLVRPAPARLAESWLCGDAQPGEGTLVAGGAHNLPLHDRITLSGIFQYTDLLNNINSRQRHVCSKRLRQRRVCPSV
jgi:hypothetical protein